MRLSLALVVLVAGVTAGAPLPREDYQKKADEAPWEWSDERASAADSARRLKGPYKAEVEPRGMFGDAVIRVIKDGEVVHFFEGHKGTVFAVRDNVLYYADFIPSSDGCGVVAWDLKARKGLWKTQLKGLGPIAHFAYHNAVTLDVDGQAVCVRGKESLGRYIEYVDRKTGKTVGHKVYSKN